MPSDPQKPYGLVGVGYIKGYQEALDKLWEQVFKIKPIEYCDENGHIYKAQVLAFIEDEKRGHNLK